MNKIILNLQKKKTFLISGVGVIFILGMILCAHFLGLLSSSKMGCIARFHIKHQDRVIDYSPEFPYFKLDSKCEIKSYVQYLEKTCENNKQDASFENVDFTFVAQKSEEFQSYFFKNACENKIKFTLLGEPYQQKIDSTNSGNQDSKIEKKLSPTETRENVSNILDIIFYRQSMGRNAEFKLPSFPKTLSSVWKTEEFNVGIHSASKASVIADQSNVFIGSDLSRFYNLDRFSGKIKWTFVFPNATQGIHSTAATDENFVYVGTYEGFVYKIHKESGQIQWSKKLGDTVGASPIIYKNFILFNVETFSRDGFLVLLKKETGEIVWRSPYLGEQSHSSPVIDERHGLIVIGVNNKTLQAFDLLSGKLIWRKQIRGEMKSTPVLYKDHLYITTWGGSVAKHTLLKGEEVWIHEIAGSQVSPVISPKENTLFVACGKNQQYIIDINSGKIIWKDSKPLSYVQKSSPILLSIKNEEYFLFHCKEKKICLIHPQKGYMQEWPISGIFSGSPYIVDDELYLSYDDGGVEAFRFNKTKSSISN